MPETVVKEMSETLPGLLEEVLSKRKSTKKTCSFTLDVKFTAENIINTGKQGHYRAKNCMGTENNSLCDKCKTVKATQQRYQRSVKIFCESFSPSLNEVKKGVWDALLKTSHELEMEKARKRKRDSYVWFNPKPEDALLKMSHELEKGHKRKRDSYVWFNPKLKPDADKPKLLMYKVAQAPYLAPKFSKPQP